ncbi:hypothetical protein Tco_1409639 [Tanacetum coccineum]
MFNAWDLKRDDDLGKEELEENDNLEEEKELSITELPKTFGTEDEKTFDTKADGSVFTSAKEKPPIPEAEPPVFTSGWILMKPQTSPERRMKRRTILKTDEDAKRKNLGVQVKNEEWTIIQEGCWLDHFKENSLLLIVMHLGFRATHKCDLRAKDDPLDRHLRDETRVTHGVSPLVMLRSWIVL